MATTTSDNYLGLVDLLQQRCKRVPFVFEADWHGPSRKRAAKRGGNSSLVRRIVHADQLPTHMKVVRGIFCKFEGH